MHPIFVHFPVALTILVIALQLARVFARVPLSTGSILILLALTVASAFLAGLTGENSFGNLEPQLTPAVVALVEEHETFADGFIWTGLVVLIGWTWGYAKGWNPVWLDRAALVALLLLGILIWETGAHGGDLVYFHGVGVTR
ncbi:MAG: hypothetical protein D6762_06980 [Candidatus Neomarinimicrobiota bacterium]|nr:MAG: hypothetical protein D6762_06980 [Candidatus Neomarinimicrobiota bacterium]